MATCSSIVAWKIPWPEEPEGLQSPWGMVPMGLQRIGHDRATKHTQDPIVKFSGILQASC